MRTDTNLDTLLKEILITPLVGAMIERGIQSRQERFVSELGKRPMSTWTDEEMHKYSVATDQACPECGMGSGDKCHAE